MNSNSSRRMSDCVGPGLRAGQAEQSSAMVLELQSKELSSFARLGPIREPAPRVRMDLPKVLSCIELPNPTEAFQKA